MFSRSIRQTGAETTHGFPGQPLQRLSAPPPSPHLRRCSVFRSLLPRRAGMVSSTPSWPGRGGSLLGEHSHLSCLLLSVHHIGLCLLEGTPTQGTTDQKFLVPGDSFGSERVCDVAGGLSTETSSGVLRIGLSANDGGVRRGSRVPIFTAGVFCGTSASGNVN